MVRNYFFSLPRFFNANNLLFWLFRGTRLSPTATATFTKGIVMANAKHVEIVRRGGEAAKAWWKENYLTSFDLSHAELTGVDLSGTVLTGMSVSFESADLEGANFRRADLRGAIFRRADLTNADLSNSDLRGTSFLLADLSGADLRYANLSQAELCEADLEGADLYGAMLKEAKSLTPGQLAASKNLEFAYIKPGRFKDAVAAGYVLMKNRPPSS